MRTTVDTTDAVSDAICGIAARDRRAFRAVLEETLLRGLAARAGQESRQGRIRPFPLGFRPAVVTQSLNRVYDQLEADDAGAGR